MAFVKLDTGVLDSTLWVDRPCREIFITALLMAEPIETDQPLEQIEVRTLNPTGFIVPIGWYGFVRAAGVGIANRALMDIEVGLDALQRLGDVDPESRSKEHEGRRLVRVDGGYIVLNYFKYRDRDHTAADRQRRLRERRRNGVMSRDSTVTSRIADADADADAEKNTKTPMSGSQTEAVFEHWKSVHNHPKAKLDPKRTKVIKKALTAYSQEDLCNAISGYKNSPHHMGQNQTGTVYDDIELFLRDAKHVEVGLKLFTKPQTTRRRTAAELEAMERERGDYDDQH